MSASPWQDALGERFQDLAPRLRAYFGPIPEGSAGRGKGVLETVGTPRRWLWPVFTVAGALRIVWPRWEHGVQVRVVNRVEDGALLGSRRFGFASGEREMIDRITSERGELVDRLGRGGLLETRYRTTVEDGALLLRSTRIALRLGALRLPLPAVAELRETVLDDGRQRVEFRLAAPGLGRVYEYAGEFEYEIGAA